MPISIPMSCRGPFRTVVDILAGQDEDDGMNPEHSELSRILIRADRHGLRLSRSCEKSGPEAGLYALIDCESGATVNPPLENRWLHSWTLGDIVLHLDEMDGGARAGNSVCGGAKFREAGGGAQETAAGSSCPWMVSVTSGGRRWVAVANSFGRSGRDSRIDKV